MGSVDNASLRYFMRFWCIIDLYNAIIIIIIIIIIIMIIIIILTAYIAPYAQQDWKHRRFTFILNVKW